MNSNKKFLIFKNNRLLIKLENQAMLIPTEQDIKNLNLDLINLELLVLKDNEEFLFAEVAKIIDMPSKFEFLNIRSLINSVDLSIFNLISKAFHLINWNNTYKYCSKCGTLVNNKEDERAKICPKCSFISYPRISPAVITAVVKDKKLLLAHNTNFSNGIYSVIAGFVEPGETFEDCVAREVFEETGIKVKNIKYFGSQPWPFPDSLMVAFTSEYDSGDIKVDGFEIDDAHFYGPNELPNTPKKGSIAGKLIDWFLLNFN